MTKEYIHSIKVLAYHKVAAVILLIAACCSLSFSAYAGSVPADELLVVGNREFAPFEFLDENGNPTGFVVDLVSSILDKNNVKYRMRLRNHPLSISRLQNGEADIMLLVFNIHKEDSLMLLSRAIGRIHYVAVCDKGIPPIEKADLKNYQVIMLEGAMFDSDLNEYVPMENRVYVDNVLDAMKLVQTDQYEIAIVPMTNAQYYMARHNNENLEIREINLPYYDVRVGVNKNRPDLLEMVNNGISSAIDDGSFNEIYLKWYGVRTHHDGSKYSHEFMYIVGIGGSIVIVLIIILIFTIMRVRRLRRIFDSESTRRKYNREQTNTLLDAVPVGVAIYDGDGNLKYINRTLQEMFPIKNPKDYIRSGNYNLFDNPLVSDRNRLRILRGEDFDFLLTYNSEIDARYQYAFVSPEDSAYFECQIRHVSSDTGEKSIFFVLHDVTKLQVTQQELESQRNCLDLALSAGKLRVWTLDVATSMIKNLYREPASGRRDEFQMKEFFSVIHPDDLPIFLSALDDIIARGMESSQAVIRVFREDGVEVTLSLHMQVVYESTGHRSQSMNILIVFR